MDNISKYISYEEGTKSRTAETLGIDNTPNQAQLAAMRLLAKEVFEPLREHFNRPIVVTSFFRSPQLNKMVGGSATSQHTNGEAMDIKVTGSNPSNADIFLFIKDRLKFDQLIWEHGNEQNPAWVHVSYSATNNRGQVLRAKKTTGKTRYTPWIG